ncbi:MAG: pyridoxal-dependent decarboxylase [Polyangiaceae bacterium]
MDWPELSAEERKRIVFDALRRNTSYEDGHLLGFPGSFLDRRVFPKLPFLEDAPYLTCLLENPNHIGCHTIADFEPTFAGTQAIERELLAICAEQILNAPADGYDGYVASGGTEANVEALWIYRNEFRQSRGVGLTGVGVLHSADTHYSIAKGANLLDLVDLEVPVDDSTRRMTSAGLDEALRRGADAGVEAIIVVLNMGTTMFGSIDPIDPVVAALERQGLPHRIHVDAAFGGFLYPLTHPDNPLSFRDPRISSFTLDAHKMLQAPYGTGIFLARKGLLPYVQTPQARYVAGTDYTLCGSRSGANAIAAWLILTAYGADGGRAFVRELVARTDRLATGLDRLGIRYFREPHMNVVTLRASDLAREVAEAFQLVPDRHDDAPRWWKVVVMDHVSDAAIEAFLAAAEARAVTTR